MRRTGLLTVLSVATPDFRGQIAFLSQWLHKGEEGRITGVFNWCFRGAIPKNSVFLIFLVLIGKNASKHSDLLIYGFTRLVLDSMRLEASIVADYLFFFLKKMYRTQEVV